MFRLIKVVLNGFMSAPLKIDQTQSHHVESCFYFLLHGTFPSPFIMTDYIS